MSVRIERLPVRAAILISYVPRGRELRFIALLPETVSLPSLPPPPPPPLSRFDTHPRLPPVMQSIWSRRSYGKLGDSEQSSNQDEFLFTDHKFASAGREDIDVLMLGRGKSEWLLRSRDRLFVLFLSLFKISKATVKRVTKTYNLLCAFYHLRTKMSCNKSGYCKLGEYRLLIS